MSAYDCLELVFKHAGGAELRAVTDDNPDGDVVIWASDSDPEFMDRFGHEIMSADRDAEEVMDYLEDNGALNAEELEELEIYDESLDAEDVASLEDAEAVIDREPSTNE